MNAYGCINCADVVELLPVGIDSYLLTFNHS